MTHLVELAIVLTKSLSERPTKWSYLNYYMIYRKVSSSWPTYYSILDPFGQRSQYISIKFPFINSLKILGCATNRDMLLLTFLLYECSLAEINNGIFRKYIPSTLMFLISPSLDNNFGHMIEIVLFNLTILSFKFNLWFTQYSVSVET